MKRFLLFVLFVVNLQIIYNKENLSVQLGIIANAQHMTYEAQNNWCEGDDLSEGYWSSMPCEFDGGKTSYVCEICNKGYDDELSRNICEYSHGDDDFEWPDWGDPWANDGGSYYGGGGYTGGGGGYSGGGSGYTGGGGGDNTSGGSYTFTTSTGNTVSITLEQYIQSVQEGQALCYSISSSDSWNKINASSIVAGLKAYQIDLCQYLKVCPKIPPLLSAFGKVTTAGSTAIAVIGLLDGDVTVSDVLGGISAGLGVGALLSSEFPPVAVTLGGFSLLFSIASISASAMENKK